MKMYSVIYKSLSDPPEIEVKKLIKNLQANNIKIHDQIPGTILVQGVEANIKNVVDRYTEWSYSAVVHTRNI